MVKAKKCDCSKNNNTCGGAMYGLGMIGAMVYFIGQASSFGEGVLGFLKALVWPVFFVLKLFESLKI